MIRERRIILPVLSSKLLASLAEEIKLWFGYTKEDRNCFQSDVLAHFIGGGGSASLLSQASLVALLQLGRRPSTGAGASPNNTQRSCEAAGGVSLDAQMARLFGNVQSFVQIHSHSSNDGFEPDETLLSVWYDPSKVSPGDALVYSNIHGLRRPINASACIEFGPPKSGNITVRYDDMIVKCPMAVSEESPAHRSSRSSLVTTWRPTDGSPSFAILGANFPSHYREGKNLMLQRAMNDTEAFLGVSQDRVFIIGDLNARLLDSAFDVCEDAQCAEGTGNTNRTMDLSHVGDVEPCAELRGHASLDECTRALHQRDSCRRDCVANIACDPASMATAVHQWSELDTKRGAGGHDLLAQYFVFPPEVATDGVPEPGFGTHSSVRSARSVRAAGAPRLPTYKRLRDEEVPDCVPSAPFLGRCQSNPCQAGLASSRGWGDGHCQVLLRECFRPSAGTTVDRCPDDDPMCAGRVVVSPHLGWLDAFGYSRGFEEDVTVLLYQDRLDMTFGDHSCFVAGASLRLQGVMAPLPEPIADVSSGMHGHSLLHRSLFSICSGPHALTFAWPLVFSALLMRNSFFCR